MKKNPYFSFFFNSLANEIFLPSKFRQTKPRPKTPVQVSEATHTQTKQSNPHSTHTMSGGSFSRVNNATLEYIRREREAQLAAAAAASEALQHDTHDDTQDDAYDDTQHDTYEDAQDDMQLDSPSDGDVPPFENPIDLLQEEDEPVENDDTKPIVLIDDLKQNDSDYSILPVGAIINTKIYDKSSPLRDTKFESECFRILEHAFVPGFVGDLSQLIQTVIDQFNFELCEVTRLRNKAQYDMHRQYKESYNISQSVVVFHGTEFAEKIARVGFRGAASKRAKFGRGIYSSRDVCHAMAYCKLTSADTLTFLVVDKHLGPTAIGVENQVYVSLLSCLSKA